MASPDYTGASFISKTHRNSYPAIDPTKRDFAGKYVFITGASKGIGEEIALSFATAGCAGIGIGARSDLSKLVPRLESAAEAAGKPKPKVVPLSLDVTITDSVIAAAKALDDAFPRIDILVNNAGYLEYRCKIIDSDPDEWWKSWNVNLRGTYLVSRYVLPIMITKGGEKTIVNVTSIAAHVTNPGGSSYQSSKLGVCRFTQFLNVDHGSDGILAYAIHPGSVLTDMGKRLPFIRDAAVTDHPKLSADTIVFLTETRREWLAGRYVSARWDMEELMSREEDIVADDKLKVRLAI